MTTRLQFHGIESLEPQPSGCLRHGFLRLLQVVPQASYDGQWRDRKTRQAIHKFQDSVFKFDRVALKLDGAVQVLRDPRPASHADLSLAAEAVSDITIYLDSMFSYFRIQADCIANVIPNLYGTRGRAANIPRDSFRKQTKWFVSTAPDFDPQYSEMLNTQLEWFNTLSGSERGQGLRDIITHYRGTYQLGTLIDDEGRTEPFVGLVNESGFVEENVIPVIRQMKFEYFRFLDGVFTIFLPRLRETVGEGFWPAYSRDPEASTRLYEFTRPLGSGWVFPLAQFRDAP